MPLKNPDPFASRAERLDATVNPYVALLRESARDGTLPLAFGPALEALPGRWREHIATFHGQAAPAERLMVEIGCHKGTTLMAMASDAAQAPGPATAFVGIDITFKRVVTTAQRARARGLKNTFCAMVNAKAIDRLFAPGEIDGVVIFFPDPWIKKARQAKNRLVDPAFALRLARVLRPGGFVWFKTDQAIYFEEARAAFEGAGYRLAAPTDDVPQVDYTSAFEQRFQEQNLPTYSGKWLTPPVSAAITLAPRA